MLISLIKIRNKIKIGKLIKSFYIKIKNQMSS